MLLQCETKRPAGRKEKYEQMTKRKAILGAALLALAILVPAAAFHLLSLHALAMIGCGIAGTATVTWASFQDGSGYHGGYTGGTTAPTAAQAYTVNSQVIQVLFGDADTTAAVTHNFGVTSAQLAAFQPYVSFVAGTLTTPSTGTLAVLTFGWTSANVLTVSKTSNTGTGGTYVVTVQRAR